MLVRAALAIGVIFVLSPVRSLGPAAESPPRATAAGEALASGVAAEAVLTQAQRLWASLPEEERRRLGRELVRRLAAGETLDAAALARMAGL